MSATRGSGLEASRRWAHRLVRGVCRTAAAVAAVGLGLSAARAIEGPRVEVRLRGTQPLMLRDDGTVWTWGVRMMQDGRPAGAFAAHAIAPLEHIVTIGGDCAVDRGGQVWTWPLDTPAAVDGITDAVAADGGFFYTIALRRDGTVWSWRDRTDRSGRVPTPAPPAPITGLDDVSAIDAGYFFAVAVTRRGEVWTWVENVRQENGGIAPRRGAAVRLDGVQDVVTAAAGTDHGLALGRDGRVWAWGRNDHGQLGDGTGIDRPQPVLVRDLTGVSAIAAGAGTSFALLGDGTVRAWGNTTWGKLGDGTTGDHRHPVSVRNLSAVIAVAAGDQGALALGADGSVWAWGANRAGQLGYPPDGAYRSRGYSAVPQRIPRLSWRHAPDAAGGSPPVPTRASAPTPPVPSSGSVTDEQVQYGLDDLRSAEPAVRRRGAERLGRLGPAARVAIPDLERATRSDDAALRSNALQAYIQIMRGDPAGIPTIVAALADPGARNRAEATLRSSGAPAVPLILALIPGADGPTRESAARVLEVADLSRENPALVAAAVAAFVPGLSDSDDAVRRSSATALASFGPLARPAAPLVIQVLDTGRSDYTRRAAVLALAAMRPGMPGGWREPMPALARALRDRYPRVSDTARQALESIGSPEAREILAQWRRGEPYVDTGHRNVPPAALPRAADPPPPAAVAGDPLREAERARAAAAVEVLKSRDPVKYLNGISALQDMGPSVVPPLLELLRTGEGGARAGAAAALSPRHRDTDAALTQQIVAGLAAALDDTMPVVRQRAAESLMEFGPRARDAVPALAGLLGDDVREVRDMAARALAAIGPDAAAAVPDLLAALRDPNEPKRWIRHALERIGTEPARQGLADYDRSADPRQQ